MRYNHWNQWTGTLVLYRLYFSCLRASNARAHGFKSRDASIRRLEVGHFSWYLLTGLSDTNLLQSSWGMIIHPHRSKDAVGLFDGSQ